MTSVSRYAPSVTVPASRRPSFEELYEQIERLPSGVTGQILVPGVLQTMSRPGAAHRLAHQNCFDALRPVNQCGSGRGWWIEIEAEIRVPGDRLVVPDLSGWRVERVPERPLENPLTALPDWACEVLSPSTARDDRTLKLPLYAECGVGWVWIIDPELQTLEVFECLKSRPTLVAVARSEDTPALPPFGIELSLKPLWATNG